MTLTFMVILNAALAVGLLGGLAFVMSRAGLLTPHQPGVTGNHWRLPKRHPARPKQQPKYRGQRVSPRVSPALD
jgi:hypothetical protein